MFPWHALVPFLGSPLSQSGISPLAQPAGLTNFTFPTAPAIDRYHGMDRSRHDTVVGSSAYLPVYHTMQSAKTHFTNSAAAAAAMSSPQYPVPVNTQYKSPLSPHLTHPHHKVQQGAHYRHPSMSHPLPHTVQHPLPPALSRLVSGGNTKSASISLPPAG